MPAVRRLAAIVAADVAGYSRLMGADEERTHERMQAHLAELVNPKIAEQRGRVVKNTGDGFLAEFGSVVDAVRCAAEIQRGMIGRNADQPNDRRIELRIGINLGDVIVESDDIFGDGVNVAARLEALAEPGGICISRTVRDHIRDKLLYPFDDLGEQSVKNIARPVRVYALRPEAIADLPGLNMPPAAPQPVVAPRLSIVVLPFANLSNDPEQQYFADGITDDLTTDLSRLAGMLVISHNTAITYRNRSVDTRQIGRNLDVRYVLEGSVRRSGNVVRVSAQLIDVESDAHIWAERFDADTVDLFTLQDEVTSRIANTLDAELITREAARETRNPDALDCILRGRAELLRPNGRERFEAAIGLFQRALALDPGSVEAQSRLAMVLAGRQMNFGSDSIERDIQQAEALTRSALATAPRDALAHFARGGVLRVQGRLDEAIAEYEAARASNPNMVHAWADIGRCKIYIGPIDEAIPPQQRAIRLSPRDPSIGIWYFRIGQAHLLQSRLDEAVQWFEKARGVEPGIPFIRAYLAAAYALRGNLESSTAELIAAQRLDLQGNYSTIARAKFRSYQLTQTRGTRPEIRELFEATYYAGLRKAGMPEE
jgi:TolB-like protein/class 3 adenylate cyclase/Flp pilus assembly protein TadD